MNKKNIAWNIFMVLAGFQLIRTGIWLIADCTKVDSS